MDISAAADRVRAKVDALARRCLKEKRPPSESLTEQDLNALDAGESRFVLRWGLISLVNDQLHTWRGSSSNRSSSRPGRSDMGVRVVRTNPMHAVAGRNPTFWLGLGIVHRGADGKMKPLLQFTMEDCNDLESEASKMRTAWSDRRTWAATAGKLLTRYSVTSVSDLSSELKADLDAMAVGAWGR